MKRIAEEVAAGHVLLADGAWGTMLQLRGLKAGECPEYWCVDRRDIVLEIARSYVGVGCDIIETNSFGANRFKLSLFGLADRAAELNRVAAAISREAAGPERHVMGSVGPCGKLLLTGDVTEAELGEAFREQVTALEAGGADACCIETMSAVDEAAVAIRAAREHTRLEVFCSFTFQRMADARYRTMMGTAPGEAARAAVAAGAHGVGANCGQGMAQMAEIVREMRAAVPDRPIIVQANAGLPQRVGGVDVFPDTPELMAAHVPAVLAAGANIVGGCCGTTPAHIAAIREVIRGRKSV